MFREPDTSKQHIMVPHPNLKHCGCSLYSSSNISRLGGKNRKNLGRFGNEKPRCYIISSNIPTPICLYIFLYLCIAA